MIRFKLKMTVPMDWSWSTSALLWSTTLRIKNTSFKSLALEGGMICESQRRLTDLGALSMGSTE